jgi:DNA invertase Pin-like site-specific DNA recombinase
MNGSRRYAIIRRKTSVFRQGAARRTGGLFINSYPIGRGPPPDFYALVHTITGRGVCIEFVKEHLTFTGEDSPMANLMLSVMGAFAEFERALLRERQREGIALAKKRGTYRGRRKALADDRIAELRQRAHGGEPKAALAREFGISRETLYQYLRAEA